MTKSKKKIWRKGEKGNQVRETHQTPAGCGYDATPRAPREQEPPQARWVHWLAFNATVFVAAACIMTVEILSTRLAARFLGSSLYTWTSAIGVVLGGISLGNYAGGRLADQYHPQRTLSLLFMISSLSCVTIPMMNSWIGQWTVMETLSWPVRIFLHFALAFLLPATMLGTMSPVVAKMALGLGHGQGRTIGTIYAWGAVGSIVGTFVAGFYLVAFMGTEGSILLIAGVLALVGLLYGYRSWVPYVGTATYGLAIFCALAPWPSTQKVGAFLGLRMAYSESVVFLEDSQYQRVLVQEMEDLNERWMVLDSLLHSKIDLARPLDLRYNYEKLYAEILHLCHPSGEPMTAMTIGGGGYVFPRYLELVYPGSHLEVAEIDPVVTKAAFKVFGLPEDTSIRYFNLDGRNRVADLIRQKKAGESVPEFDFIFGDAFNDFNVPYHLTTLEFNQLLDELLSDDGIYMLNLIDRYASGRFLGAIINTGRAVFPHVYVFSARTLTSDRGTFVVVNAKRPLDVEDIVVSLQAKGTFSGKILEPADFAQLEKASNAMILTDDYAPVENLLVPVVTKHAGSMHSVLTEASTLLEGGNAAEAAVRLRTAIKASPYKSSLHNQLGKALTELGDIDGAAVAFSQAVRLTPTSPKFRSNLGLAYQDLDRDAEAVAEYRECMRLDESNAPVMNALARLLAASNDDRVRSGVEAVSWAERLLELIGNHPEALDTLAVAYAEAGRFSDAVATAERAIQFAESRGRDQLADQIRESLESYRAEEPLRRR